jgi:rod shape-determining protein MreC
VILETTRIRGILRGTASGQLQIVGLLADQRIKPGEKVLTAGGDLIFPRGLPVGVVEKVVPDADRDSFIDVIVKPAAHLDRLDEVLVITSTEPRFSAEQQQDMATSEMLKGAEAEAIKQQQKASQIMAERLPGLTDPNAPANPAAPGQTAQPGETPASPAAAPVPKLLPALHPDRFTPGATPSTGEENPTPAGPENKPESKPDQKTQPPSGQPGRNP